MSMLRNRQEIARMFAESGFTKGAEIGVFDGYYSEILCKTIPGLELISVDPWLVYSGYRDHKFESSMRRAESLARERLEPYNVAIYKMTSLEAAQEVPDESLDFVYIDANHEYKYVKEDIAAWTPKVRLGGVIAGDDYYMTKTGNFGVIQAVHEYVDENGYELQLTPWDLSNPKEDDQQPQWWFARA